MIKLFLNLDISCICKILKLIAGSEPITSLLSIRSCLEITFLPCKTRLCNGIEYLELRIHFKSRQCQSRKINWLKTNYSFFSLPFPFLWISCAFDTLYYCCFQWVSSFSFKTLKSIVATKAAHNITRPFTDCIDFKTLFPLFLTKDIAVHLVQRRGKSTWLYTLKMNVIFVRKIQIFPHVEAIYFQRETRPGELSKFQICFMWCKRDCRHHPDAGNSSAGLKGDKVNLTIVWKEK